MLEKPERISRHVLKVLSEKLELLQDLMLGEEGPKSWDEQPKSWAEQIRHG